MASDLLVFLRGEHVNRAARYIERLLSGPYQVQTVPDGEAALAAVRQRMPDLILTDVMMPRLDGVGLLRALRCDPRTAGVPVILLSARAGEESWIEGMEAGADAYLVKPFSAKELLARVGALLQITRLRQAADESIRASEERFRAFVSASSDVIYRMSADWTEMRHLQGREFIADAERKGCGSAVFKGVLFPSSEDRARARQGAATSQVAKPSWRASRRANRCLSFASRCTQRRTD